MLALAKRMYYGGTVLTMEDILYAQALLVEDGVIRDVRIEGGCNGNLKAISKILNGQTVEFIVDKLSGNTCGFKNTSCADQLACAVKSAYDEENRI